MKACTLPNGAACAGTFVGCDSANNPGSRVNCEAANPSPNVEPCQAYGQLCTASGSNNDGLCGGAKLRACSTTGCQGTNLVLCDDAGVDHGLDCASFGAGTCAASALTCAPESAGTCTPSPGIWCDGGVATACLTGAPEAVDCSRVAGLNNCIDTPEAGVGAAPSSACRTFSPPECTADKCSDTSTLAACVRGHKVSITCASEGLVGCASVMTRSDGPRDTCVTK